MFIKFELFRTVTITSVIVKRMTWQSHNNKPWKISHQYEKWGKDIPTHFKVQEGFFAIHNSYIFRQFASTWISV